MSRKPVPLTHWWKGCLASGQGATSAEGGVQLQEGQSRPDKAFVCARVPVRKGVNRPSAHFLRGHYKPGAILGAGRAAVSTALGVPALVKLAFQWEKIGSKHRLLNTYCVWGDECGGEQAG